jgi:hypothetical protein
MRVLVLLVALPLLAGCGEWDYLTSFGTSKRAEAEAPAPPPARIAQTAPAGAQPAPDPFCLGVARQDATTNGFDQATEGKVAIRSYQQCVGLFGASAGK